MRAPVTDRLRLPLFDLEEVVVTGRRLVDDAIDTAAETLKGINAKGILAEVGAAARFGSLLELLLTPMANGGRGTGEITDEVMRRNPISTTPPLPIAPTIPPPADVEVTPLADYVPPLLYPTLDEFVVKGRPIDSTPSATPGLPGVSIYSPDFRFAPLHPDVDIPFPDISIVPPRDITGAAPAIPGAVPIGIPNVGRIVPIVDSDWWELAPAVAAPSPLRPPTLVPFIPPFDFPRGPDVRNPTGPSGTTTGVVPDLSVGSTPRTGSDVGISPNVPGITSNPAVPTTIAPSVPRTTSPAIPDRTLDTLATPGITGPFPFASPRPDTRLDVGTTPNLAPPSVGNPTKTDECDCAPKKKKKKSEPRTECFRGTYRQLKKGIIYNRIEKVPCDAAGAKPRRTRQTADEKRAKNNARKRKKKPSIGDLAKDVFGF